jgi:hypothetical protein
VPPQLLSVDLKNFDTSATSTYVPVIKNNPVCVDIHDLTMQPSKVGILIDYIRFSQGPSQYYFLQFIDDIVS